MAKLRRILAHGLTAATLLAGGDATADQQPGLSDYCGTAYPGEYTQQEAHSQIDLSATRQGRMLVERAIYACMHPAPDQSVYVQRFAGGAIQYDWLLRGERAGKFAMTVVTRERGGMVDADHITSFDFNARPNPIGKVTNLHAAQTDGSWDATYRTLYPSSVYHMAEHSDPEKIRTLFLDAQRVIADTLNNN